MDIRRNDLGSEMTEEGQLPDLREDDRNMIVLSLRAGFNPSTACWIANVPEADFHDWMDQGRADADEDKDTEPAKFARMVRSAMDEAARTHVIAANILRDTVREDPAAALRHLRELTAQRDLERVRELTAGT